MGISFPCFKACLKTVSFWVDTQPSPQLDHILSREGKDRAGTSHFVCSLRLHRTSMAHQFCTTLTVLPGGSETNRISSTVEGMQEDWVKSQEEQPQVSRFLL